MALTFSNSQIATLKAKSTEGTLISTPGITTSDTLTPAQAAVQVNKILSIVGKEVVADTNMVRTQSEEVVDNG